MAVIDVADPAQPVLAESPGSPAPAGAGAPIRVMAVSLWAVVGSLLAYGVLQTAVKAAALFG